MGYITGIPNHDRSLLAGSDPGNGSGDYYCETCDLYHEAYDVEWEDEQGEPVSDPLCPLCRTVLRYVGPDDEYYPPEELY